MPGSRKPLWINLCLLNLCIVALFGLLLRSKIVFSIPVVDYSNLLTAHSHVALAGWAGLGLITLLVYELLPLPVAQKPVFQWLLLVLEVSTLGMAATFPFWGYNWASASFSSLYFLATFVFAIFFIKQVWAQAVNTTIGLLSIVALVSLLVSTIGPLGQVYISLSRSTNAVLYRDSIYTFLHFQYNGFFTLAVFALFLNQLLKKGVPLNGQARLFALFLCLAVPPTLFLSLLWHERADFYVIAAVGCVLLLLTLVFFVLWLRQLQTATLFKEPLARALWRLAVFSFVLKTLLNVGTIFPPLGRAVYGDRPAIIGFLHLVFLGFLTFYLLAMLVEYGYFKKSHSTVIYPFILFGAGIIANEVLLMLQGLSILLQTTSFVFNWLLWGSSLLLFAGAVWLVVERYRTGGSSIKKP